MKLIVGNILWQLVQQSDAMTKSILLILFFLSVVCWSIVLYKIILFNIKRRQLKMVVCEIMRAERMSDVVSVSKVYAKTFPGNLLCVQLDQAKRLLHKRAMYHMTDQDYIFLDNQRMAIIDDMMRQEEAYLPMLSSASDIAPLLGLFGTIWGLTHSFINISQRHMADIVTIAPGVAEALLTTLAGLMVAIPAMAMFHWLKSKVCCIESQLYKISDHVHGMIKIDLVDTKEQNEESVVSGRSSHGSAIS